MEYIVILIISIVSIFIMKFAFQIKIKDFKKIKSIGYDKKLNEITNKLPENKEVCEKILTDFDNRKVKIEINEDKDSSLSYYMALTDHIIIANINDTFTRIQTIAHECLHSIQNRKMLMFNFIFSNIYILYFLIISVLTILKVKHEPLIFVTILILMGFVQYAVRSYLETDAMTKAPYVAEKYIKETEKLSKEELETIMQNYKELNKIGIPITNFQLMLSNIIKIIIYCVIATIIVNI